MDYNVLLDLVVELGYQLAISGAETYRIEDSIYRILSAYNIDNDVWSIPNCITVSIRTPEGETLTRLKRIGFHGNDLDSVEQFNALSRRICAQKPQPSEAFQWIEDAKAAKTHYRLPLLLLGNILVAAGFCIFFGGAITDALCAGLCGCLLGLTDLFLEKKRSNLFFKTIVCAFILSLVARLTGAVGLADNTDTVTIGTLMLLVPGLLFTNALRDIIFGDINSGTNRMVQVFLIAAAIALGTGVAWSLSNVLWGIPLNSPAINYGCLVECLSAMVACIGFFILFNIHGPGGFLCAFGGAVAWSVYCLASFLGAGELLCYFFAALAAAGYSEIAARIRKSPAISYLVVAILPLIPGAGIYYTTNHLVVGDMTGFATQGSHTLAIAGVIAVGILVISTIMRFYSERKQNRR